jgi:hypothetical protein
MTLDLSATPAPSSSTSAGGITQPSHAGGRGGFLSDVVLELGFADSEEIDRAVAEAREPGKLFERILVDSGAIDENQLARAIAERNGLPYVDLDEFEIDESAEKLISRDDALRYRALPLAFDADGSLIVALADPLDGLAISDIAAITQSEVIATVASAGQIAELAENLPQRNRLALVRAELEAQGSDNVENELEEVVAMDQLAKDPAIVEATAADVDPEAVSPQAIAPEDAAGQEAQAFTIPESIDDFEMPEPVVVESGESQTFKLPEPMSAYEAAFGAPVEPAVETEPVAIVVEVDEFEVDEFEVDEVEEAEPAAGEFEVGAAEEVETPADHPVDNSSASELNQLAVELGQAREENDQLSARLEDSLSRIEQLEEANQRLLVAEQQIEQFEREREDSAAAPSEELEAEHRLERERAEAIEARLCKRLAKAKARNEELEQLVDEMVSAVGTAHSTSERVLALQAKLSGLLEEAPKDK